MLHGYGPLEGDPNMEDGRTNRCEKKHYTLDPAMIFANIFLNFPLTFVNKSPSFFFLLKAA